MLKRFISFLLLFTTLFTADTILPQMYYEEVQPVNISITVIKASNDGSKVIDPKLQHLSSQLARLNYNSYQFLMQDSKSGFPKEDIFFYLPNGDVMRVVPLSVENEFIKLYVVMKKAGLSTNFKIAKDGTVIVGGDRYKGGSLIIAITTTY